jgi:hypothetical protein
MRDIVRKTDLNGDGVDEKRRHGARHVDRNGNAG